MEWITISCNFHGGELTQVAPLQRLGLPTKKNPPFGLPQLAFISNRQAGLLAGAPKAECCADRGVRFFTRKSSGKRNPNSEHLLLRPVPRSFVLWDEGRRSSSSTATDIYNTARGVSLLRISIKSRDGKQTGLKSSRPNMVAAGWS